MDFCCCKNQSEMIAVWSGSCKHCLVDSGRLLVCLGTSPCCQRVTGSEELSEWWLVALVASLVHSSICDVSDYSLLVLCSIDFVFSPLFRELHLESNFSKKQEIAHSNFVLPACEGFVFIYYCTYISTLLQTFLFTLYLPEMFVLRLFFGVASCMHTAKLL